MAQGGQEIEVKIALSDVKSARQLVRGAGFRVWKRRILEKNTVFDTRDGKLRKARKLLRVREAHGATLTYKGVPIAGRHKTREELELTVSDAGVMSAIAQRLGFAPQFRYEKYRTEFQQPGFKGVITIDETPIGVFLELEGTPTWIDRTARKLGFAEKDYITASYGRLYLDWCKANRVRPGNMVFE